MATIVKYLKNNKKYILIGSGYGMHKSLTYRHFSVFNGFAIKKETGDLRTICVSDEKGELFWLLSKDIEVYSVNGVKPSELLDAKNFY